MKITDEQNKKVLKLHNLLFFFSKKSKKNNKEEHADKLCFAQYQKFDTKRGKIFISIMRINLAARKINDLKVSRANHKSSYFSSL